MCAHSPEGHRVTQTTQRPGDPTHIFFHHVKPLLTPLVLSLIGGASSEGHSDRRSCPYGSSTHLLTLWHLAGDLLSRWTHGGSAPHSGLWLAQRQAATGFGGETPLTDILWKKRGLPQTLPLLSIIVSVQKESRKARRQAAALLPSLPAPLLPVLPGLDKEAWCHLS